MSKVTKGPSGHCTPSYERFRVARYETEVSQSDFSRFPHKCSRCGSPAYNGFTSAECSRKDCK